jgi:Icc-related predicted phosphoesterase
LNISKIYLTHMGPALSSTSLDRNGKDTPIFGGSKSLDKVDDDDNLLVHLHGHIHGGAKYDV